MRALRIFVFLLALAAVLTLSACDCGDDDDDDFDHVDDDDDDDDNDTTPDDDDDDATPDDDDDDTPDVDDEIAEGKRWLHYGDGDRANLHFHNALVLVPDHEEGNYGLVIGHGLHSLDLTSIVIDYVDSLIENGGPVKDEDPDNVLDAFLEEIYQGLIGQTATEQREQVELCTEEGYEFWQDDPIPLIIHFEELGEMTGHFDDAEAHALLAPTALLQSILEHFTALSLDLDISYGAQFAFLDWDDLWDAIGDVIDILLAMLTDPQYPDFLTLPEYEVERFQDAGLHLAEACNELLLAFEAIKADTDDQSDDQLAYVDLNANGQYDTGEPFRLPGIGELNADDMELAAAILSLATELRDSLWDYTEYDPDPSTTDPFHLSALNPLLQALGWPLPIPDWSFLEFDLGAIYAEPGHDGLKQTLIIILRIADLFIE